MLIGYFLNSFIGGLKFYIKLFVKVFDFQILFEVIDYVRFQDEIVKVIKFVEKFSRYMNFVIFNFKVNLLLLFILSWKFIFRLYKVIGFIFIFIRIFLLVFL